jgi:hypothetical protein
MGRKDENRISRNKEIKESKENKEDDSNEDDEEDNSFYEQIEDERRFNIIMNAMNDIMQYVEDNSLPLCDYLNQKSIEIFVDSLINQ